MKSSNMVVVFGVGGITILGVTALVMGQNGTTLASTMAAIAAIVGYCFGKRKE